MLPGSGTESRSVGCNVQPILVFAPMNDREFKKLLDWFGLSWNGYYKVRKGVKKRLQKQMQQLDCRDMGDYLALLRKNGQVREHCRILLTVSISRFFRDLELWKALQKHIIPRLITTGLDPVRVWSAGCARGEEIHSFKILWHLAGESCSGVPRLEAWATDMNPDSLAAARQGVYSASSLKEMPQAWKQRYFRPLPQKPLFALQDSIKEGIFWQVGDLLYGDPPVGKFHLVFLRNNLMTYYDSALVRPALAKVTASIASGGYLVVGAKEKLPETVSEIRASGYHPALFVKALD